MEGPSSAAARFRARLRFTSLPNPSEMQLPPLSSLARVPTPQLPLRGEVATPREGAGDGGSASSPVAAFAAGGGQGGSGSGGGSSSSSASGSRRPAASGSASPMLYLAPLPALGSSSSSSSSSSDSPRSPALGGFGALSLNAAGSSNSDSSSGGGDSSRAALRRAPLSFVAGGLMQSMSAGRLPIAASPQPSPQSQPGLELRSAAVPSEPPPPAVAAAPGGLRARLAALLTRDHAWTALEWLIRFTLHIVLLAMFESIFFWSFVSVSEDDALQKLVGGYVSSTLQTCPSWNATARDIVTVLADALLNQSAIRAQGAAAAAARAAFNGDLFVRSWAYFGGLAGLLAALVAVPLAARRHMPWGVIVGENCVLILMLGLYELLFFKTIVLRYEAISGAELVRGVGGAARALAARSLPFLTPHDPTPHTPLLDEPQDSRVVDQFYNSCTNRSWWVP